MSDEGTTTRGAAAKLAAGPGLSEKAAFELWRYFERQGIIPPAIGAVQRRGDPTLLWPMAYGAAFAVMADLYRAGIVRTRQHLASMFAFLAIPDREGDQARIAIILAEIAAGNPCWLVLTLWRDERSGDTVPTCAVRFADETDKPIVAPSQHHEAVADYVIKLHLLLERFAERTVH